MLDTIKPETTAVQILPGPLNCSSVDPERADRRNLVPNDSLLVPCNIPL